MFFIKTINNNNNNNNKFKSLFLPRVEEFIIIGGDNKRVCLQLKL